MVMQNASQTASQYFAFALCTALTQNSGYALRQHSTHASTQPKTQKVFMLVAVVGKDFFRIEGRNLRMVRNHFGEVDFFRVKLNGEYVPNIGDRRRTRISCRASSRPKKIENQDLKKNQDQN